MDNNFTQEELSRPVVWGELIEVLKEITKTITDNDIKAQEGTLESVSKVCKAIIEKIEEESYNRIRCERYFIGLLSNINNVSSEELLKNYKEYCEAFDVLNKKVRQ